MTIHCPTCGGPIIVRPVIAKVVRRNEAYIEAHWDFTDVEHSCPDPTKDVTR